MADDRPRFDPLGVLASLDRHRVAYVVVGAFARVVHGADEVTLGLDIVPSTKPENLKRLNAALRDIGVRGADGRDFSVDNLNQEALVELSTDRGDLKLVAEPAGTRGYDDLRRAATREPLGRGVRPSVASIDDLGRMMAALRREHDGAKLRSLRRLAELDHGLEVSL